MQRLSNVKLCDNTDLDDGVNSHYVCGRKHGHDGKHVAFDDGGMVIAEWYPPDIGGFIRIEFIQKRVTR